MRRKIIRIDDTKCSGCGACAAACHEGAIEMIGGKAKLTREDYCDGLGDCLPACPTGAITFEEREAIAYDGAAVQKAKAQKAAGCHSGGCPGSRAAILSGRNRPDAPDAPAVRSELSQWPCQLRLVPVYAPYFEGADLLVAADCAAYAYGNFHRDFMKNHITLIACPKLDGGDWPEKLLAIIAGNHIKSVTVVRMEVPCCSGIEWAVKRAVEASGKSVPCRTVTVTTDGKILP